MKSSLQNRRSSKGDTLDDLHDVVIESEIKAAFADVHSSMMTASNAINSTNSGAMAIMALVNGSRIHIANCGMNRAFIVDQNPDTGG